MARNWWVALLTLFLALPALAQERGMEEVTLYGGDLAESKGLSFGSWGSGGVEETDKVRFENRPVLLIYTDGLYAGGRLEWSPPLDVKGILADKFGYLRMMVHIPGRAAAPAFPGMPGAPGVPGMPGMPGFPGMPPWWQMEGLTPSFGRQMMAGQMGPPWDWGMPGPPGMPPGVERRPLREIGALRLLIQTDGDDWLALPPYKLDLSKAGPKGWLELNIPLKRFSRSGEVGPESKLKQLLIFGDTEGEVYVGRLSLARDPSPIRISVIAAYRGRFLHEVDCTVGDEVRFVAKAEGGLATVEVRWQVLPERALEGPGSPHQGREEERGPPEATTEELRIGGHPFREGVGRKPPFGVGEEFTFTFDRPGGYLVTATAVDIDGVKPEARATIRVHVHPPG